MRLNVDAAAFEEARQAAHWYDERSPGVGQDFLDAVDDELARITSDPHCGARLETFPLAANVRRRILKRFAYMIIYELLTDEIRILAVAHERRRANYWKGRLRG